jgi:hypothetical protein
MCASQGRRVARKEALQLDLLLVLPPHGMGQSFCQRLSHGPRPQEGAEQGTQHICSFGCRRHRRQILVGSSPCKYAPQLSRRMTHPTGMHLVDHFLAPVHGRGIYHRCTSGTDLLHPHASTILSGMVWHSLRGRHCPTSPTLGLVSFPRPCSAFPMKHCKKKLSAGLFLLAHRVPLHEVCPARSLMVLTYLLPLAFLCYKVGC